MQDDIPVTVKNYRATLLLDSRRMAYLRLNDQNCVDTSGGDLEQCGISQISHGKQVEKYIDSLVGLLPVGEKPVIIVNAQTQSNLFVDLHLFKDSEAQWVILFDNTKAALELQNEQQERLSHDILLETRSLSQKSQ